MFCMRSALRLRSIFWLRKYSKQGVYMHSSDGNISVYVLIGTFWISQRLLGVEVSWHHDKDDQVFQHTWLILSKEMNTLCFTFTLSCFLGGAFMCCSMTTLAFLHMLNGRHEYGKMATRDVRLATHARTIAVNQDMRRKLWQMQKNLLKFIAIKLFTRPNNPSKTGCFHMP